MKGIYRVESVHPTAGRVLMVGFFASWTKEAVEKAFPGPGFEVTPVELQPLPTTPQRREDYPQ